MICFSMVFYSGYQIYTIYSGYAQADKTYAEASEKYVKKTNREGPSAHTSFVTEPTEPLNLAPIQVDFDALLQENEDVVGWIYSPDSTMNYPIVQAEDNDYYLRRMLDGSYNYSGSIFMDYRCDEDFQDFNSIIYGHNMNNDGMFASLADYQDPEFCKTHPVMYLLTPDADYQIDVIASIQTGADSNLYCFPDNRKEFEKYLRSAIRESLICVEVDPESVERTVMLSTCSYEFQDARYIVIGSLKQLDRLPE